MSTSTSRVNHSDGFEIPRQRMVERLRDHYKIKSERVLDVMNRVPRHLFVPEALRSQAYKDNALPISSGQTISQPFIVAKMSELLELAGREKVLEIGAGSGYQTAVLAALSRSVFAIERLPNLADEAKKKLKQIGAFNVSLKCDDGTVGWPMYAPFDAMLAAAGSPQIPEPLIEQLKVGGRLVIPIGDDQKTQTLVRVIRTEAGYSTESFGPCAFVPLIGQFGWESR